MGGTLQTGRLLKYNGNPHTSLLQSMALAMGAPKMSVFGDWDKGPLPGSVLDGATDDRARQPVVRP